MGFMAILVVLVHLHICSVSDLSELQFHFLKKIRVLRVGSLTECSTFLLALLFVYWIISTPVHSGQTLYHTNSSRDAYWFSLVKQML